MRGCTRGAKTDRNSPFRPVFGAATPSSGSAAREVRQPSKLEWPLACSASHRFTAVGWKRNSLPILRAGRSPTCTSRRTNFSVTLNLSANSLTVSSASTWASAPGDNSSGGASVPAGASAAGDTGSATSSRATAGFAVGASSSELGRGGRGGGGGGCGRATLLSVPGASAAVPAGTGGGGGVGLHGGAGGPTLPSVTGPACPTGFASQSFGMSVSLLRWLVSGSSVSDSPVAPSRAVGWRAPGCGFAPRS